MTRRVAGWWQKYRYVISALVLLLPPWFYYQSLNPVFPDAFPALHIGDMEIVAMPFNDGPPYKHDDIYVKDFLLLFNSGKVEDIRQAYLNIGEQALPLSELEQQDLGILHGTRHGQHAHALAKKHISKNQKLWLTLQTWQGKVLIAHWRMPDWLVQ